MVVKHKFRPVANFGHQALLELQCRIRDKMPVLRFFLDTSQEMYIVSKMQVRKDIDPIATLLSLSTTLYPGLGSAPFHSDKDYLNGGQT